MGKLESIFPTWSPKLYQNSQIWQMSFSHVNHFTAQVSGKIESLKIKDLTTINPSSEIEVHIIFQLGYSSACT